MDSPPIRLESDAAARIAELESQVRELRLLVESADEAFSNAVDPVRDSHNPLEAWRFRALCALGRTDTP